MANYLYETQPLIAMPCMLIINLYRMIDFNFILALFPTNLVLSILVEVRALGLSFQCQLNIP